MSIEQVGNALVFRAHFTNNGTNLTGATVTVTVYNETGTALVTGVAATEIGNGLYGYTLASTSVDAAGLYTAVFDAGTSNVDQRNIAGQWAVGVAGVENLNATVSSRLVGGSGNQTLLNRLDANISSRLVGGSGNQTLISNLVNLDATVSSRLPASNYTAPPSVADVWNSPTRTLSDYGTLVADTSQAVWNQSTRELTSLSDTIRENIGLSVWRSPSRELTTLGQTIADYIAGRVWAHGTREITDHTDAQLRLIGEQVWDSTNKQLSDLDNITSLQPEVLNAIAARVWAEATRTLSGISTDQADEIAARVWLVTDRIVTGLSTGARGHVGDAVWTRVGRTVDSVATIRIDNIVLDASEVFNALTANMTRTGSIGRFLVENIPAIYTRLGEPAGDSIADDISNISTSGGSGGSRGSGLTLIGGSSVGNTITGAPVDRLGFVNIRVGDDYLTADMRSFVWSLQGQEGLVGGTANFAVNNVRVATGLVTDGGTNTDGATVQRVTVEANRTQTMLLSGEVGTRRSYTVQITINGNLITTISGVANVLPTHPTT